jgi:Nif-specific regulatory protein
MALSSSSLSALEHADWPGNVRQLRNALDNAAVNARMDGVTTIEPRHIFDADSESEPEGDPKTFAQARERFEQGFLRSALEQRDWNVAQTARELDMSRSHLNALIRRYRIRNR